MNKKRVCYCRLLFLFILTVVSLQGCGIIPRSGPSYSEVMPGGSDNKDSFSIVDIDNSVAQRVIAAKKRKSFSDIFDVETARSTVIGKGDFLEITLWEAPPAVLFGTASLDIRSGVSTARNVTLPEQMVSDEGKVTIPFIGSILAAGKTLSEIETDIAKRLSGKANQPQVMARITRNVSAVATVVGEVVQNNRFPLTARGERVLDAIAAAGGVRQPVGKVTLQITRGAIVQSMPLERVIQDPKQNVRLIPGDVLTAMYQPLSFISLGATGRNEEISFEAQGITLAQALARTGGIQDQRADAKALFIFRYEEPLVVGVAGENPPLTPEGKTPVIYRADLRDPRSFFIAQNFPIQDKDVIYVSNAPAAELQKFMNILTSIVFTAQGLGAIAR